jgi:hypothetical protein
VRSSIRFGHKPIQRVIDSAARRIEEIENELKTIESGVEADSLKRIIDSAARNSRRFIRSPYRRRADRYLKDERRMHSLRVGNQPESYLTARWIGPPFNS